MPKNKFIIKQDVDYACDYHYGSMALKSHLPEYKTCSLLNSLLDIKLHKIPDLSMWHPTETMVDFPFYIFEDSITKVSCYLLSNNGIEKTSDSQQDEYALFESQPKRFNLFGKKNSSIYTVKDLNIDYYLIMKHPRDDKRIHDFVEKLADFNSIQTVSVESSEYLKYHNELLCDIELSMSEYKSLTSSDIRRRKLILKKKDNSQETPIFKKKFYNI
jgi:hypothetical protein